MGDTINLTLDTSNKTQGISNQVRGITNLILGIANQIKAISLPILVINNQLMDTLRLILDTNNLILDTHSQPLLVTSHIEASKVGSIKLQLTSQPQPHSLRVSNQSMLQYQATDLPNLNLVVRDIIQGSWAEVY